MANMIIFQPSGIMTVGEDNQSLLRAAREAGIQLPAYCGGGKSCGKCKVKILEGSFSKYQLDSSQASLSEISEEEKQYLTSQQIADGYRLACAALVKGDVAVEIPLESRMQSQVILETGSGQETDKLNPGVKTYYIEVEKPTLQDNRDDLTRLTDALKVYQELDDNLEIDYTALIDLPDVLRKGDWKLTVYILYRRKIIGVVSGKLCVNYGAAVDIGTTTIAAYLCDLNSGELLQTASSMNPQVGYGDDVISRISYCMDEKDGVKVLQKLIIDELNSSLKEMADKQGITADRISEVVMVFNTVMEYITLGITPEYLGSAPFVSPAAQPLDIPARELGLRIMKGANVHCLPPEAGFVGADNVAVLISQEPYFQDKMQLIVDIGTNSEICLGNSKGLYTTSCATGPALEGAQIKWGMRAARGAIEGVEIDIDSLEPKLRVIGGDDTVPVGICGSGILDAVAQMAETGILRSDGRFASDLATDRIRKDETGKYEYVLYFGQNCSEHDVTVTIQDIRAVQLAKAALYAGAKILMEHCSVNQVDEVILAGAFGSYINKENALKLGLLPDCRYKNIRVVGNAAGVGARLALLNTKKRLEAQETAAKVQFIETAAEDNFQKYFTEAMVIPHKRDAFPLNKPTTFPCTAIHEVGQGTVESSYPYANLDELQERGGPDYEAIERVILKNSRENLPAGLIDIPGPFAVLGDLVPPERLYASGKRQGELLDAYLTDIALMLADYAEKAIQDGIRIISYADPAGVMELTGIDFYKKFSGKASRLFLRQVEPHLKKSLIHICGKTSCSLERAGYLLAWPQRINIKEPYLDILFREAENRKMKLVGHACINREYPAIPVLYRLECI